MPSSNRREQSVRLLGSFVFLSENKAVGEMGFYSSGKYLEYWGFTISGNQNTGAEPFNFLRVPWGYFLSPVTAWPLFCSQQIAHALIVVTDLKCHCKTQIVQMLL